MSPRRHLASWVLVCALLAVVAAPLRAQQPATADASVPLFTVMAAVNAAGYDAALDSTNNHPVRKQVRQDIAAARPASLDALRTFYAAHRNPNPARDLSQFISFALLLGPAPDFNFRVKEAELPREVAAMAEFRPLLASFYREANLERLWEKYRPAYEQELQRYDEGLARVMMEVNGYLRISTSTFLGRNFSVYVDLLGAPGQVNARSFGPDYFVVASASPEPQLEEVRHGYLHYVLEPMALKYSSVIRSKSILHGFGDEAHALDPVLRKDFRMLLTESLIRAAEVRMGRGSPIARQAHLQDILLEGHFLAPYFYEALEQFEKQDVGMRLYYPDMIEKIDVGKEQKRLAKVTFRPAPLAGTNGSPHMVALGEALPAGTAAAASASAASTPTGHGAQPAGASDEHKLIAQGEDALARQDLPEARRAFQAALDLNGSMQGNALYGLAIAATLEKQREVAKNFFRQTLERTTDARLLAWANIYLGRIYDMEENRELAVKHYQQALAAANEPAARQAAERGLKVPFRREGQKEERP